MIKIGVFGAGHLGKTHLKLAEASKELDLIDSTIPTRDGQCRFHKEIQGI